MIAFWRDQKGSVAVIVAVTAMILIMILGAVIDFGTATYVRSNLQSAVDAASLAAGKTDPVVDPQGVPKVAETEEAYRVVAQRIFNANNGVSKLATTDPVKITYTAPVGISPDTVLVSISAKMPTMFLSNFGIGNLDITVESKSQRPQPGPVDLVLVLDRTKSMEASPSGGGEAKLDSLKAAAKDLVEQVMASGNPNIKVGVVPYSNYVFIGRPADPDKPPSWILPIVRNEKQCTSRSKKEEDCTTLKVYDCLIDGVMKEDGCKDQLCKCLSTVDRVYRWNGTIGARSVLAPNDPDDRSKNDKTDKYVGRIDDLPENDEEKTKKPAFSGQNDVAASGDLIPTQIRPLTTNKQDVLDTIKALKAAGDTHIPTGLIWGWNVLTPEVPYTEGRTKKQLDDIGGRKVLLLMTDGINANSPRLWDGAILPNAAASPDWRDGTKSNDLTRELCNSIKAQEIEIYTVRFDVPENAVGAPGISGILRDCATDPETMSFEATNRDGLLKAFRNITDQLKSLKIVQ